MGVIDMLGGAYTAPPAKAPLTRAFRPRLSFVPAPSLAAPRSADRLGRADLAHVAGEVGPLARHQGPRAQTEGPPSAQDRTAAAAATHTARTRSRQPACYRTRRLGADEPAKNWRQAISIKRRQSDTAVAKMLPTNSDKSGRLKKIRDDHLRCYFRSSDVVSEWCIPEPIAARRSFFGVQGSSRSHRGY